jgi:hypothetical protein
LTDKDDKSTQMRKNYTRPFEPADIDLLYKLENNLEIWEASNTKAPFSKHILTQYFSGWFSRHNCMFFIKIGL